MGRLEADHIKSWNKTDISVSYLVAYYAIIYQWGMMAWYPTNVGEGESERYLLIRESERARIGNEQDQTTLRGLRGPISKVL